MLLKVEVEFKEGDVVYFTFSQEFPYIVRGYEIRDSRVIYILFHPEMGEVSGFASELTTERSVY